MIPIAGVTFWGSNSSLGLRGLFEGLQKRALKMVGPFVGQMA